MLGSSQSDDQLIAQVATGDRAALAVLFDRHGPAVLRLARASLHEPSDAEDVLQETFVAALRGAATYRPELASVRTWLFAIARNAARRHKRQTRELPSADVDDGPLLALGIAAGWGAATDVAQDQPAEIAQLARAVASLAPDDRQVVLLRDVEGLSGEEAAALLELSLAALKSRLHRARLRLLAALRADEGGVVSNERTVGGLSCRAVLSLLGDYVDGDLGAAERARVDLHLRGCTVCERFGGRYAGVVHAARDRLGAVHAVDVETFERVKAKLSPAS